MLIDVFTERGFTAVVDIQKKNVPARIDPKSYEIINRTKNVYRVRINFDWIQNSSRSLKGIIIPHSLFHLSLYGPKVYHISNKFSLTLGRFKTGGESIHAFDIPDEMTLALVRAVREKCGPFCAIAKHGRIDRECVLGARKIQFSSALGWELERMKEMDAYIALRGSSNVFETSDLPQKT